MKKLVIYFSYTGHTKMIAEKIAKALNCDIEEIVPEKPYSKNYDTVVNEYQNNEIKKETPKIKELSVDLNNYDEIIIGTPVWWYTITPPIRTFLKENNLTGKKIIPFATNAGWVGRTFKEIKELCSNSNVENEMNIVFTEDYKSNELVTSSKEVENWINKL